MSSTGNPWGTNTPWCKEAVGPPSPLMLVCATCKTPGELIDGRLGIQLTIDQPGCLLACQGCLAEYYCGSECWAQDYARHKHHCHFTVCFILMSGDNFKVEQCWDSMTIYELKHRTEVITGARKEQMVLVSDHQPLEPQQTLREAGVQQTRRVSMIMQPRPALED